MPYFEGEPQANQNLLRRVGRQTAVATLAAAAFAASSPALATANNKSVVHIEHATGGGNEETTQNKNRHFNRANQKLAKQVMVGVATTMLEQYRETQKSPNTIQQDLFLLEDLNEAGTLVRLSHNSFASNGSGNVNVVMQRINGRLVPATASSVTVSTAKKDGSLVNTFNLDNTSGAGLVFEAAYKVADSTVFISTFDDSNSEPPTDTVLHRALGQIQPEAHRILGDKKVISLYPPLDVPPELHGAVVFH